MKDDSLKDKGGIEAAPDPAEVEKPPEVLYEEPPYVAFMVNPDGSLTLRLSKAMADLGWDTAYIVGLKGMALLEKTYKQRLASG